MKLELVTDLEDTRWLTYVMEEFIRIQGARFELLIRRPGTAAQLDDEERARPCLYYCAQVVRNDRKKVSVPRRNDGRNLSVVYVRPLCYCLADTICANGGFDIDYDVLWNAFFFLSRYREYHLAIDRNPTRSYSIRYDGMREDFYTIPIVNVYFKELQSILMKVFPAIVFAASARPIIELSHDVDYLERTPQFRAKTAVFSLRKALKCVSIPRRALEQLVRGFRFLGAKSYHCFNAWIALEEELGFRSIFYVYAKTGRKTGITSMLLDPSYDVVRDMRLRNELERVLKRSFDIGLHGSVGSAADRSLLEMEKETLETAVGHRVVKIRQHWLSFHEAITPFSHEALFKEDSTIGWNDRVGYRAGCASRYRPYDHRNQRPFSYYEIPQIVMDSTVYDHGFPNEERIEHSVLRMIQSLLAGLYASVHVSISWHQRTISPDYRWEPLYARILALMRAAA